jgi:hypothetical protein
MYTGTLISDLMATVERIGQAATQQQIADEPELQSIFAMQISVTQGDQLLMGAA